MSDRPRELKILKITRMREYARAIVTTIREPLLVLDKNYKVVAANDKFYALFNFKEDSTETRSVFELFGKDTSPGLENLLGVVLSVKGKVTDSIFTCRFPHTFPQTFLVNASLLKRDPEEEELILISFKETTEGLHQSIISYKKSFQDILAHAPAMICTLRGPEHVFELANENYLNLLGNREIIGKPVREAVPEAENQGFFEILDNVYQSGNPFIGNEVPINLKVSPHTVKSSFLNFLYQPTRNFEGEIDGIFVHAIDVTEQVLSRKKIEKSKNHLRVILDTVPAIIWMTNKDGKASFLNRNWYDYTGQSKKEIHGFGWLDSVHLEDRERVETEFKNAHTKKKPYSLTYKLRIKDGSYRWVMDSGRPKFDVNGRYEGLIGTVVDVHEEKIKEYLIREKEHRLRNIVEEATVATAVYTSGDMIIELANDAMIEVWGKDRSVLGTPLRQAIPELEGQPFHHLLQEVYTTGKTYWGKEERVDLMKGDKLQTGFFNFTYKPLRDKKGEIYGILNMAIDVTETVKSKKLLKESESRFRQMADFMPHKVVNIDPEGNFIYFNQNWLDYTGLTSEALKARGVGGFLHSQEKESFLEMWKHSLNTGKNFEMEFRLKDKNGRYKWHLSRAEAIKDETGRIKMWIGTNTEIQRIKEEEKRKEDFLKMVSHELKTPVTSIKGYAQLLLSLLKNANGKEVQLASLPLKPSLERIDHQINRLTRLISEMLDLSRLEENKLDLQKQIFPLNDLVTETVQDINYTNTQHKLKVFHDYKCEVFADKDRIGQVLINFVTNAIKYSPNNQDIEIRIQKAEKGRVAVSVRDWGIGIDKKDHQNIFKRFYRIGGKSEETYAGFGIGLYLANEIIQRHNGFITVMSEKEKGSEFIFTLEIASSNK